MLPNIVEKWMLTSRFPAQFRAEKQMPCGIYHTPERDFTYGCILFWDID